VNALLESGAAVNIVGINGTPLDIAKRYASDIVLVDSCATSLRSSQSSPVRSQNDKRLVVALLKHKQKKEPSNYRMNKDDAQYLGYAYSSAGYVSSFPWRACRVFAKRAHWTHLI
jgi:hypothetical protein